MRRCSNDARNKPPELSPISGVTAWDQTVSGHYLPSHGIELCLNMSRIFIITKVKGKRLGNVSGKLFKKIIENA